MKRNFFFCHAYVCYVLACIYPSYYEGQTNLPQNLNSLQITCYNPPVKMASTFPPLYIEGIINDPRPHEV